MKQIELFVETLALHPFFQPPLLLMGPPQAIKEVLKTSGSSGLEGLHATGRLFVTNEYLTLLLSS